MTEQETFELIKGNILLIQENKRKPVRIAINGIEGTGKTEMAKKID